MKNSTALALILSREHLRKRAVQTLALVAFGTCLAFVGPSGSQEIGGYTTAIGGGGATKVTVTSPPDDVTAGPTGFTGTGTLAVSNHGSGSVGVQATGSGTGLTFSFQATIDGTNWFSVNAFTSTGAIVTSASANGNWIIPTSGFTQVRVNLTAISGGTETFTLNSSAASVQQPLGTQGTSTNLTGINGTAPITAGVAGAVAIGGTVATNVAITANPLNLGAQAVSSENSAVTTARQVQLVADLVGKLIVLPYANPENFISGVITSAMTGTTSTSLVASPGGSLRNYITQITCYNTHATVGTDLLVQDGSGGTTIYLVPAAIAYGGAVITFPTPLRQPTTATALFVANVTTGASTKCAASGYKGL